MNPDDIFNRFTSHPATTEETQNAHTSVRQKCYELAEFLNDLLPESREKSLAVTHLEEVMFWANASIARETP